MVIIISITFMKLHFVCLHLYTYVLTHIINIIYTYFIIFSQMACVTVFVHMDVQLY